MYTDGIPGLILTCGEIARGDLFHAERELSPGTLRDVKHSLENALVVVDAVIALQKAGQSPHGRQLALRSRGRREFKLFTERENESEMSNGTGPRDPRRTGF